MVDRKAYKLLQRSKGEFNLPPLKEYETESPEVVTEWDDTGCDFWGKYKGWYFFVYGPDGALLVEKASRLFFPPMSSMDNLVEGKYYDKSLKALSAPGRRRK